ncbi:type VI secretion system secreted protein VgrG [Lysobacter sp. yr284]|uniref:type VI secretion system tip protein TssI/VgrG n=1 Tax=Lysobacter sp. yr284 TaxID=1761791 RepID=UPI0008948242|nr:type VI secretion system tip protein TssI/VgrG [Lysobacter sp. yr284]SDZ02084.1 type VI secretion system secreted protein VgrG [Lysobacter sp. yr284]
MSVKTGPTDPGGSPLIDSGITPSDGQTALFKELDNTIHDSKTSLARELEGLARASPSIPDVDDALDMTAQLAQATGGEDIAKIARGVQSATQIAQSVASDDLGSAFTDGVQLAGMSDPRIGQFAQAAKSLPQATALLEKFQPSSGLGPTPGFNPNGEMPRFVDDHPLTGSTLADATSPSLNYAPPVARQLLEEAGQAISGQLEDATRLMRLVSPLSGDKRLYISSLSGSAALSDLSSYQLQLLSLNAAIDLKDVISQNLTVMFKLDDGTEHPLNGYVASFGFSRTDGGLAVYSAELVPWLWYLGKRRNSRIFQDVNVIDVAEQIFRDYGSLPDYELRVFKKPPPQNYIVQYNESDLNFVSRLLEQFGLFYYFEHRPDGHKLIICDDSTHAQACPAQTHQPLVHFNDGGHPSEQDELTALSAVRTVQIGSVAMNTYDFKDPIGRRAVEQTTVTQQGAVPTLQDYDGMPAFAYRDIEDGNREAKLRMEAYEWQSKLFMGQSHCRSMVVGHTFKIADHHWFDPSDEQSSDFLLVGAQIDARNNFGQEQGDVFSNTLTLIRRKIPYRPVRHHTKPIMPGPQSASVVGPKGEEIHTDKFGRIKVQFPWDRYGKFDDASSCWIRVSQPWAGRGWGTIAIPRIGQEVIISFLEGDPDRPVCIGRLFNAEQTPPRGLPDSAHTMGFISNSTPGGGGQCRMLIKDAAGQELIDLFSQRDMAVETLRNQDTIVRGPKQTNTVTKGFQTNTVKQYIATKAEAAHVATTAHTYMQLVAETQYFSATAKTAIGLTAETEGLAAQAKKRVYVQSQTEHVLIKGKTAVRLEAGGASLELREDGTVLLNGTIVQIVGSTSIDLNP